MRQALALIAALLAAFDAGAAADLPMIDAHAHYSAADAVTFTPAEIVAKLDAGSVRKLVATSSPPELAQRLYQFAPDRIVPLLGVYDTDLDKGNWMHDPALPARVAARLDDGTWAGLGELHLFAADARQPVFEALVRLAAERRLVLMLHADPAVIERAFEVAPTVRILWAHLGTEPEPALLDGMLGRYPRLWIDTSVRDERIAPDGVLLPEWRTLFERHSERFVVAVDTFSVNRWRHYEAVVTNIRRWLHPLPQSLKINLLHDNAARLFDGFRPPPARPAAGAADAPRARGTENHLISQTQR